MLQRLCHMPSTRAAALCFFLCGTSLYVLTADAIQTSDQKHQAECHIHIRGASVYDNFTASLQCWGEGAVVTVREELLQAFQGNFTGVYGHKHCLDCAIGLKCLVSVCSGSVLLRDSSIIAVPEGMAGGLDALLCVGGSATLDVYTSRFHHNLVTSLACAGQAIMTLHGSEVYQNMVQTHAGGVFVRDSCCLTITDGSTVQNNTARWNGGGIYAQNNSSVALSKESTVQGNMAGVNFNTTPPHFDSAMDAYVRGIKEEGLWRWCQTNVPNVTILPVPLPKLPVDNLLRQNGGGVFALDRVRVDITDWSIVQGNFASRAGGGLFVKGAALTVSGGSSLSGNTAGTYGGGLVALDSNVSITGGSRVTMNTACNSGGGVVALWDTTVALSDGCSLHHNLASTDAGGVLAWGRTVSPNINITDSAIDYNVAGRGGGGVVVWDNATTVLINSIVRGNIAAAGGGIVATDNANVTIKGGRVSYNLARDGIGGGLAISDNATARIFGSTVVGNACQGGGGGGLCVGALRWKQFATDIQSMTVSQGYGGKAISSSEPTCSLAHVDIVDTNITLNNSTGAAGGGLAVAYNATVSLSGSSQIVENQAVMGSGGGAVLGGNASLFVASGVHVAGNMATTGVSSSPKANAMKALVVVGGDIAAYQNSTLRLPTVGNLTKCSPSVYLARPCEEGEIQSGGVCVCCAPYSFNFDGSGNAVCKPCPSTANCTGGSQVYPKPGYWHSSNKSDLIVRCPLFSTSCAQRHEPGMFATPEDSQCNTSLGYHGRLCGQCRLPEFGMVMPFVCSRCEDLEKQLAWCATWWVLTVIFVFVAVGFASLGNTPKDQEDGHGGKEVAAYAGNTALSQAEAPGLLEGFTMNVGGNGPRSKFGLSADTADHALFWEIGNAPQIVPSSSADRHRDGAVQVSGSMGGTACQLPNGGVPKALVVATGGDVVVMVAGSPPEAAATAGTVGTPRPEIEPVVETTPESVARSQARPVAAPQQATTTRGRPEPHEATTVWPQAGVTDYLKVLVLFVQYMLIILSIQIPWGVDIHSGDNSSFLQLSLECWLSRNAPGAVAKAAIIRLVMTFAAPFCIFLAVVALQLCFSYIFSLMDTVSPGVHNPQQQLPACLGLLASGWEKLRQAVHQVPPLLLTILWVLYFKYPALLQASFSFFSCVHIDHDLPYTLGAEYPLNHSDGYWVQDVREPCFATNGTSGAGYHLVWAMWLGLPFVFLLGIFVPLVMGIGLGCRTVVKNHPDRHAQPQSLLQWALGWGWRHIYSLWHAMLRKVVQYSWCSCCSLQPDYQHDARAGAGLPARKEPRWFFTNSAECLGFLYQDYKQSDGSGDRSWWEAVWAARTVFLTLIAVQSIPMGRYYSVLSLLVVFLFSAALQGVLKPFEFDELHYMHIASTCCLIVTSLVALAMFGYDVELADGRVSETAQTVRHVFTCFVIALDSCFVLASLVCMWATCCARRKSVGNGSNPVGQARF